MISVRFSVKNCSTEVSSTRRLVTLTVRKKVPEIYSQTVRMYAESFNWVLRFLNQSEGHEATSTPARFYQSQ